MWQFLTRNYAGRFTEMRQHFTRSYTKMRQNEAEFLTRNYTERFNKMQQLLTRNYTERDMFLFVGYLTSQQHASVSRGQICSDNFTCCHTEIEVADQTFHLTQSQYTDISPTIPSTDPIMPGAWQGSTLERPFFFNH